MIRRRICTWARTTLTSLARSRTPNKKQIAVICKGGPGQAASIKVMFEPKRSSSTERTAAGGTAFFPRSSESRFSRPRLPRLRNRDFGSFPTVSQWEGDLRHPHYFRPLEFGTDIVPARVTVFSRSLELFRILVEACSRGDMFTNGKFENW